MSDENTVYAELLKLSEKIATITAQLDDFTKEVAATYASKAYVQAYIENILGELTPIHNAYTEDTSISGYIPLDINVVLKHFRNIGGAYTLNDYRSILLSYDKATKLGNINPYIAIAQMVKETDWGRSWWSQRPRRNPAGIGVTGETSAKEQDKNLWAFDNDKNIWKKGYSFTSWEIAAQAHIGHLLAYTIKDIDLNIDQRYLVALDPRAKYIAANIRGTVKTLKQLEGHWSTSNAGYARSIAIIANVIKV